MTVGSGVSPDLLTPLKRAARGLMGCTHITTGGEFRPALRTGSTCHKQPKNTSWFETYLKRFLMHPNSIYRETETVRNLQFVPETGFGHLLRSLENYALVSHIPFLLMEDAQEVELHLVRSNPIAHLLKR